MIQPDGIRRKAANLYSAFVGAWLQGDAFFPRTIPCRREPDGDLSVAIDSVHRLREGSKQVQGYGYTVRWTDINSRKYGRNLFPERIVFETQADFLRYLGKQEEFAAFAAAVDRIRGRYPELEGWIRSRRQLLIELAGELEGLLLVADYLRENPRPALFAREIPVAVDTKFIAHNHRVTVQGLQQGVYFLHLYFLH